MYAVTQHPPSIIGPKPLGRNGDVKAQSKFPPGMCSKQSTLHCPCPLTTGGLWSGAVCSEPVSLVGWGQNQVWYQDLLLFSRFGTQKIAFRRFSTNGTMVPDAVPEKSF